MSDLQEALNGILSSPQDMERLMGLAKELSGSLGLDLGGGGEEERPQKRETSAPVELGGLDPKMLNMMGRIMGEFSSGRDEKMALLNSLKPYLKDRRRGELERAVKIARLARIARSAFSEFGGDLNI